MEYSAAWSEHSLLHKRNNIIQIINHKMFIISRLYFVQIFRPFIFMPQLLTYYLLNMYPAYHPEYYPAKRWKGVFFIKGWE